MSVKYDPVPGQHIGGCIEKAIEIAKIVGECVEFTFNGTTVDILPNHADQVYRAWHSLRPDGIPVGSNGK